LGERLHKVWKMNATISLDFGSDENAIIFQRSFSPELNTLPTHRSIIELVPKGAIMTIIFKAEDVTALRAAINSVLQFAQVVDTTINKIEDSDSNCAEDDED